MRSPIALSYVISTRDRLPYLRILFGELLPALGPDEEIVVVDGDSTDGSCAYLQQLLNEGKIHQYVSGPDRNQAQGWNLAMLMARGTIIKKLIDDDVPCFLAIARCKAFMLADDSVDICISDCLTTDLLRPGQVSLASRRTQFEKWSQGKSPCFTFSDVHMLIRRTSLSFIGLYDTQFTMIDWEYALRASFLQANIAYYTGYNALAVATPGNITSRTSVLTLRTEGRIGRSKYGYAGDRSEISLYSELKIAIGRWIGYRSGKGVPPTRPDAVTEPLEKVYHSLYRILEHANRTGDFVFLYHEKAGQN